MQLVFATICKFAESSDEGKFLNIMGAGIGGFRVPHLPMRLPQLYLAARLVHDAQEYGYAQSIGVAWKSANQGTLYEFENTIVHPMVSAESRQKSASNLIIISMGLPAREDGVHYFELTHDDAVLGKIELDIILVRSAKGGPSDV